MNYRLNAARNSPVLSPRPSIHDPELCLTGNRDAVREWEADAESRAMRVLTSTPVQRIYTRLEMVDYLRTCGQVNRARGSMQAADIFYQAADELSRYDADLFARRPAEFERIDDSASVEALNLSRRVVRLLQDAGIGTVAELCSRTEYDLISIRGFGSGSWGWVRGALRKFGRTLRKE